MRLKVATDGSMTMDGTPEDFAMFFFAQDFLNSQQEKKDFTEEVTQWLEELEVVNE